MESPDRAGRRPTSRPACSGRGRHRTVTAVTLPATATLSRHTELLRSASQPLHHTPSIKIDARKPISIVQYIELASTVAHRQQPAVLLPETACEHREISSSCGGDVCRATQERRAAKWGQAADSLPIFVRVRRQAALGGAGDLFTPNQRLSVAAQRGALTLLVPRGMSRRERLGGAN